LAKYDAVIVSIHNTNQSPHKNYGVTKQTIDFVNALTKKTYVIVSMFGNPYSLSRFKNIHKAKAVVVSYTDNQMTRSLTAQAIYGGIAAEGKLPVSVTEDFPERTGISTPQKRLKYITPKEIGIDQKRLNAIDSIVEDAIMQKAIPGCQIFAAIDGKVFFYKAYGYHTYDSLRPVKRTDIYDLASITKVAATTASLMKLKDMGKFDVSDELATYIPALDTTDKKHIIARDALAHYAKIPGWLPFYASTLDNYGNLNNTIYSKTLHGIFNTEIAENIFIRSDYRDSILFKIYSEKLKRQRRYKYSDLAFYLFQEIVEKQSKQSINTFAAEQFYRPLGASTLGYKPLAHFDKQRIVPTEDDIIYRKQLIHGYVHDAGAAMLGGVAGHAGLFANANDLGILMQMFLQKGEYAGVQYISQETVELFRQRPFKARKNRRALGFDRPLAKYNEHAHTCAEVSDESFGHTGFTGTIAWVDPKYNINFVLLSNRVYPKMENMKFVRMNVRPKVQKVIYDAVLNSPYINRNELAEENSFFHSLIKKGK
jgi:beta-N-acetylhexosaminidase